MAEETGDRGASAAAAGIESAAMALALVGMSREKADALGQEQIKLIAEQTSLARLQIEDLRREDGLRHWSLRVRHISDVMKLAFEFSVAAILLAIVLLIGGAVWNAAHDDGLVIEAFSVPPDLAARGLTGEVVASKVLDRLSAMQSETQSTRAASSYANNWDNDIKVQVPDTGVSIGEIDRFLHEEFGHQTHIKGEVYRTAGGIAVTARTGDIGGATFTGSEANIGTLIDATAKAIFRTTQPYRYAMYLRTVAARQGNPKGFADANAVLWDLVRAGTVNDRAWSYDGLGDGLGFDGDLYGSVAMIRRAIATRPTLDAYTDLARTEGYLQHEEDVLKTRKGAETLITQVADTEMNASAAFAAALFNKQDLALEQGDNLAALNYGDQMDFAPGSGQVLSPSYVDKLQACGALHDWRCVLKVWAAPPPNLVYPDAFIRRARMRLAEVLTGHSNEAAHEAPLTMRMPPSAAKMMAEFEKRTNAPLDALIDANFGDFKRAHATIDMTPLDCEICLRFRGRIDALERSWGGADYWFVRAVRFAPSVPFAYADWGWALLGKGDNDGAIAKFTLANLIGPHFADPLEMWGEALMLKNRSDQALAKFEEAAKYAPNWGRLHLKWGEALIYAGKPDEAKQQFAIASGLDLSSADRAQLAGVSGPHG